MPAVVVYESMFGNTRKVAEAIAGGLGDAVAVQVGKATAATVAGANLLVVGGPTHMHTMSRPVSRQIAARIADKPGSGFTLEPVAAETGLREWFAALGRLDADCAAFDTRGSGPAFLTGRAANGIHRRLRRHGGHPVATPHSFLIGNDNAISAGELHRAEQWGIDLADAVRRRGDAKTGGNR